MKKIPCLSGGGMPALKKLRLIMRLNLFLLLISVFPVAAGVNAQNAKLNLKMTKATIAEVFDAIEQKSDVYFFYNKQEVDDTQLVDVAFENRTIEEVLDYFEENFSISYQLSGKKIIIKPQAGEFSAQQKRKITGKVTDSSGQPLPGVTVLFKGTTKGTVTNFEGDYSIQDVSADGILVFSFVGMKSTEVEVGDKSTISVVLHDETKGLDEVVVVGFGTQKKESVVGAIETIDAKELRLPSSNLTNSFGGRMAGVIAVQRSGEPGADGSNFWIRGISTFAGSTSPLIFLDGVEVSTGDLSALPPESIEGFSILKDATATALYGARGANGVMLVTTRNGRDMDKPKINVRVQNTFNSPTQILELADGVTNMKMHNEAILTRNPDGTPMYSENKIQGTIEKRDPYIYPNVNWQEYLFKDMSMNQGANLNVTGGGKKVDYFISSSLNVDNGMLKSDPLNNFDNNIQNIRYSFQANVNAKLTQTTKIGLRINSQIQNYKGSSSSTSDIYKQVFAAPAVLFAPVLPAQFGEDHIIFGNKSGGHLPTNNADIFYNPYATMVSGHTNRDASTVITTFNFDQKLDFITKGLSVDGIISFKNYTRTNVTRSFNPFYYEVIDPELQEDGTYNYSYQVLTDGRTALSTSTSNSGDRLVNMQAALNYKRTFDQHDLSAMLVYLQRDYNGNTPSNFYQSLPQRNQGIAGRITYGYNNKYLLEANFGYNGSENFMEGRRFGFFPSMALGYIISNEDYFASIKPVISNLKIRCSYGLVGNSFTNPRFPYLTQVDLNGGGYWFGEDWQTSGNGANITKYGTEDAQWEVGQKINLGVDVGIYDKLSLVFEIFREDRSDIFMVRNTIPAETGVVGNEKPTANLGRVRNQGIDLMADYRQIIKSDFIISAKGTFTYAKNELIARDEPQLPYDYLSDIGHPLNRYKGLIAIGLFEDQEDIDNSPVQTFSPNYAPGDIKYADLNGDNRIDDLDKKQLGNPTVPQITYGFGVSANYKKFDASVFFQGVAQTSLLMNDIHPFGGANYGLLKFIADDYWSESNPRTDAKYPRLTNGANANNHRTSSYWLRNGSFMRLKNAEIGYTYNFCRFYMSGQNLLTFSEFKHWDPELGGGNGLTYPNQRMVTLGLQMTF